MADQDAQDKNLPASAKKIQRSRAEGQVPRSRDLGHFAVILTGGALLAAGGPEGVTWLQQLMDFSLRFDAELLAKPGVMTERFLDVGLCGLLLSLGVGLCLSLVAVLSSVALGGWNFTMKAVAPKFSNLNPLTGIARLFQWQGLGQALKACGLALVLALIAGLVMKNRIANYVGIMSVPLPAALAYAGEQLMGGLAFLGLGLALFAIIDVPLQYQLYMKRLKMSREEVKQEFKELEGNQEVKSRMRAKMREMAKRRMLAAVPTADLVVMNPTHYAVALKYEEGRMAAPQVVAKGADLLAMKIRDLAKDAKVPVLQSPMLARALYAHAELDREIPAALFAAVAQVLAYVYQLRAALAGRGVAPALPDPVVPPELDPHNKPAAQRRGAPEDDEQ